MMGNSLLQSFVKRYCCKTFPASPADSTDRRSRFNQRGFLSYPSPLVGEGKGEGEEG